MALNVDTLTIGRARLPILTGIRFRLEPGKALILRGPNGIGKTTLLRSVAGLTPPLSGTIDLAGQSVAYAGHDNGLKAQLSIAENLRFWAAIYGEAAVDAALDAFDLTALAPRRAADLSAGQKRRVALARLLLTGCTLWCLDEPNVALDRANSARFADLVQRHLEQGGSALIATHAPLGFEADSLDLSQFTLAPEAWGRADGFAWEPRA